MYPLFQELSYATRRMISADSLVLKEFGITYSQWTFIVYLDHHQPSSLAPIARYYLIKKPAITVIKKKFLDLGWIQEQVGTDQRERLVSLTQKGQRNFKIINQRIRQLEQHFFKRLTESEKKQLQEMLFRINREDANK